MNPLKIRSFILQEYSISDIEHFYGTWVQDFNINNFENIIRHIN